MKSIEYPARFQRNDRHASQPSAQDFEARLPAHSGRTIYLQRKQNLQAARRMTSS